MTEAGAISAVAAFFRQSMDACAWAEEKEASPPFSANTSAPGAPPLLRFPLCSTDSNSPFGTAHSNISDGISALPVAFSRGRRGHATALLELVVSRGPGPDFSEHETRVASQAAVLLYQAVVRVRDRAAFSEAQNALEDSFRGMEEASEAVAVLVKERERRAQHEAQQMADVEEKHAEAMSAAGERLERARREAEKLRGQLVEAERSVAAIAGGAKGLCRTVSAGAAACGAGDLAERGFGLPDDEGGCEVIAVIERATRNALRCSFARVVQRPSAENEARPSVAAAEGESGRVVRRTPSFSGRQRGEGGSASSDASGLYADDREEGEANSDNEQSSSDDETEAVGKLHVPIPYYGRLAEPLVLSIHGVSNPPQLFGEIDRTAASALAACLGTALLVLREKKHTLRLLRQAEADQQARAQRQQAAAVSKAAAAVEAQERGERAVAGMRALVAAAQASKAQAEASASATRRAERHTDALRYLLSGLGEAGNDHAAVAAVVDKLASAVVPGCLGAVLLTPRLDKGPFTSFSPDPRTWVTAAASRTSRGVTCSERDGRGRRAPKGFGRQWTGKVEEAAAEAATTGKAICVMSNNNNNNTDSCGRDGGDGGSSSGSWVVFFSPVVAVLPAESENIVGSSDAMCGSCNTPCLIAWMLCQSAGTGIGDVVGDDECSEAPWASVSLLTEPFTSIPDVEAASASPSPPLPPRVSSAMEAVVQAVGLALSAIAAAAATHTHRRQERSNNNALSARRRPSSRTRAQDVENARERLMMSLPGDNRLERKSHRDEEMKRLRDGTAALTDRVQVLEGRAAGLRASEARSAAALARTRADAGALKGELQLTALERDRLVRRLEETDWGGGTAAVAAAAVVALAAGREVMQREQEERVRRKPLAARSIDSLAETPSNLSSRRGQGGSSGGLTGAFRPYWEPPTTSINAQPCGLAGARQQYVGGGMDIPRVAAGDRNIFPNANNLAGVKESEIRDGEIGEEAKAEMSVSSLPPPPADASSAALQRMASVHARLSDSLKRRSQQ